MNHIFTIAALGTALFFTFGGDFSAAQSTPVRNETNICTGHPTNGLLPNLGDCTRYFRCAIGSIPVPLQCGNNQQFNSTTLECTSQRVQCFQCPRDQYFLDMPVDYNCLQFVRCFAGRAQQRTCSEGLLFDPVRRQCNFHRQVQCACPRNDIPTRPFFVRSWANCDKYSVCVNGTSVAGSCPPGLHFNVRIQQCDHPDAVDCNGPSTSGF